jgi:hypothetical protein
MFQVEFIGGPYDGHRQTCLFEHMQLPPNVIWPVCDDAFAQLKGTIHCQTGTITSIALYELEWKSGVVRYRFIAAIAFNDFENSLRGIAAMPRKTR